MDPENGQLVILGAGPAGLSCAERLTRAGLDVVIVDRNDRPGGLARTESFDGHLFDVGPHRFYTKNREVEAFWKEFAGDDLIRVKRMTRILYENKLFQYPLQPLEALLGLGVWRSTRAISSYVVARATSWTRPLRNFEDWVVAKFGRVLYETFFQTYTEKIWGIPCHEIGVEWAEQRIKGLSLRSVIGNGLGLGSRHVVKSLIDEFLYTRRGAGQVYENIAETVRQRGSRLMLSSRVTRIHMNQGKVEAITYENDKGTKTIPVRHVFTSIPLTEFVANQIPPAPPECVGAAKALYYRDHITVNLVVSRVHLFPDQWVYVHDRNVRMARVSEYGNFSPEMTTPDTAAISVEYFCFSSDPLWRACDQELIDLATEELARSGLLKEPEVIGGFVIREADSYPAYYLGHRPHFEALKAFVSGIPNATAIGRGGMYKYNNQDHSILSGMCAARRFLGEDLDVWAVNTDTSYLEEDQTVITAGGVMED